MHIPDGMLDTKTVATTLAGSGGLVAYAAARVRKTLPQSRIVLMAVLAALIFALQALNFPVAIGTSGHFAGGAAAAIVLGPWPAMLVMCTVLLIQAFVFADGGVLAFGANALSMAIVGPFVGYAVYRLVARMLDSRSVRVAAAFLGALVAVVASAVTAALMIWASGRAPFGPLVLSMAGWHTLIGLGEGVITAGLVGYVQSVRPDILEGGEEARPGRLAWTLAAASGLLAVLSLFAAATPDGLEFVAGRLGFLTEPIALLPSPAPDYALPGIANSTLAGVFAALGGTIVAGALVYSMLTALKSRRPS